MRILKTSSRTLASVAVLSILGLVGLSACGGGGDDSGTSTGDSGGAAEPALPNDGPQADSSGQRAGATDNEQAFIPGGSASSGKSSSTQPDLLPPEALIKTGSVSLQSTNIGHVLTQVYGLVGGVGGDISKEDTTTDEKGNAVRSTLVLRVPVDEFDSTLNELSQLGTLVNRVRSSKDVTIEVADIDSRVRSAQRSITTLRQLFDRATKLSDIIRLESELAQRESDLEALEAQQRALNDKTTMSTITMTLELPLTAKPKPKDDDDKAGGFVAGIQQGWDALKSTLVAVGHLIGVVLPLGTLAVLVAALGYWFVRRFVLAPHHQGSAPEEPAKA